MMKISSIGNVAITLAARTTDPDAGPVHTGGQRLQSASVRVRPQHFAVEVDQVRRPSTCDRGEELLRVEGALVDPEVDVRVFRLEGVHPGGSDLVRKAEAERG